jgi:hypothetical protein
MAMTGVQVNEIVYLSAVDLPAALVPLPQLRAQLVGIEAAADAALAGAPLPGVAPIEPTAGALLGALARGNLSALQASSRAAAAHERPSAAQASHFQQIMAVEKLFVGDTFRRLFGVTGRDPTEPLTAATTYILNASTPLQRLFEESFYSDLNVNMAVTFKQQMQFVTMQFGEGHELLSIMAASPVQASPAPPEIQALSSAHVLDKFVGLATGRPDVWANRIQRMLRHYLDRGSNAFSCWDAIRFTDKSLREVPGHLAEYHALDPLTYSEADITQSLSAFLDSRMVINDSRVDRLAAQRVYRSLPAPTGPHQDNSSYKRASSESLASPGKRGLGVGGFAGARDSMAASELAALASGQAASDAWSSRSRVREAARERSPFSWQGSPIAQTDLPRNVCFYHVAGKHPCGGAAAAGGACSKGYSHAPFPPAVAARRTAFVRWLKDESGFVFK